MHTAPVVAEAVLQAMRSLVPDKTIGEGSGSGAIALAGRTRDGKRSYVQYESFAGGVGGAFQRSPEAALDDVRQGYVSVEKARSDYGVLVRKEEAEITLDPDATWELRLVVDNPTLLNIDETKQMPEINSNVQRGTPCSKGTQTPFHDIVAMFAEGDSVDANQAAYPILTEVQIKTTRTMRPSLSACVCVTARDMRSSVQCATVQHGKKRRRQIMQAIILLATFLLVGATHAAGERIDRNFKPSGVEGKKVPAVPLSALKITKGMLDVQMNYREQLETLTVTPPGDGPFPLMVMSHGTSTKGGEKARKALRLRGLLGVAEDFARRGYKVVIFARRGYASSSGRSKEGYGGCSAANKWSFAEAAREGGFNYHAVIEALVNQPDVDGSTVIAGGNSAGGFAVSTLAADPPPGLVGIINFSGGRGGAKDGGNCSEDGYVGAFGSFGEGAKVPALWLYSETDKLFWPELVDKALDAYAKNGAPVRFERVGALWYSTNGHRLVRPGGRELWGPRVDAFLNDIAAPNWGRPPTDAVVKRLPPPDGLSRRGRRSWKSYLSRVRHKAYAYDAEEGRYVWTSGRESVDAAKEGVMKRCRKKGYHQCKIINVDGKMVN